MTASLHCGIAIHRALTADATTFDRGALTGYQPTETNSGDPDLLAIRQCPRCGCDISRSIGLGIRERLALARRTDDVAMIGWCRAALTGDPVAVQVYLDKVADEALIGGAA